MRCVYVWRLSVVGCCKVVWIVVLGVFVDIRSYGCGDWEFIEVVFWS